MEVILKEMIFNDLKIETQEYLVGLNNVIDVGDEIGIPVYLRDEETFFFINDFKLKNKANRVFEKGAAEYNLYRGGAVVMILTKIEEEQAMLVVPDERYNWAKPVAGIAHFDEGFDLTKTGRRELGEEAFLFTLDEKNRKRIVPKGLKDAPNTNSLGFESAEVVECGEVVIDHFAINNDNRGFEAVMVWKVDFEEKFSYTHNEDWWQGGHSGIVAYAIAMDDQRFLGFFSGQQGFIPLPKYGLHPTLEGYIQK